MFADYKLLVIQEYERKKAANDLSQRLIDPTPGQLRDECIAVCNERYTKKDDPTLRTFFKHCIDAAAYIEVIANYRAERFKNLSKFLRDTNIDTHIKNVELLAWLIDFQDRPFVYGKKYNPNVPDMQSPPEIHPNQGLTLPAGLIPPTDPILPSDPAPPVDLTPRLGTIPPAKPISTPSHKPQLNLKARIAITVSILLISIAIAIFWPRHSSGSIMATTNQGCMYWAGDHYEPIPCTQKLNGVIIVPLDSERLNNFKKINCPDTITHKSKGKVYYIKINKTIEYYTAGGAYPLDFTLRVRPLTDYMIRKYIDSMRSE